MSSNACSVFFFWQDGNLRLLDLKRIGTHCVEDSCKRQWCKLFEIFSLSVVGDLSTKKND
jgi:hypothetical protein